MTLNSTINEALQQVRGYQGCFMYDKSPTYITPGEVFVVNLATTKEADRGRAGHFGVVDYRDPNICMFFDPYGLMSFEGRTILNRVFEDDISPYYITDTISRSAGYDHGYNPIDFQAYHLNHGEPDDLCGLYAIAYVRNPSFERNPVFLDRYLLWKENPHLTIEDELRADRLIDPSLQQLGERLGIVLPAS